MTEVVEVNPVSLRRTPLPQAEPGGDKNSRGQVLVIGGSVEVAGAALLAGVGALRAGAGKLMFAAPQPYAVPLALQAPEARVVGGPADEAGELAASAVEGLRGSLEHVDAVVVGPGTLDGTAAGRLAEALMRAAPKAAFLVDAAAMTGLAALEGAAALCAGRAVLTPHAGEMAKIMSITKEAVEQDPVGTALAAAARLHATVVLKGEQTHVATPDGRVWRNSAGVQGLGVSGSGDVLSGVIGGLLARGAPPHVAAIWGVYAHAQSGRRLASDVAPSGFLAREILDHIPRELAAAAV